MIRHSKTEGNEQRRYIGRTDQPLSESGIELAREAAKVYAREIDEPDEVYVTPLMRTQMTAQILFPHAKQIVVDGLREMDFGIFEGRNADEMKDDAAYREWVAGMCRGSCPEGEKKDEFSERVCHAFSKLVHEEAAQKDMLVMVLHGGTIMSICERYALPKTDFYDIFLTNCQGVMLEAACDGDSLKLTNRRIFTI